MRLGTGDTGVPWQARKPRLHHCSSLRVSKCLTILRDYPGGTMISQTKNPRKRRRPAHSCVECRRRKVRCDRNKPCTQCTTHKFVPCVYEDGKLSSRTPTESPVIAFEETQQTDGQTLPTSDEHLPRASPRVSAPAGPIRGTVSKTRIFGHGHWMNTMSMVINYS